MGSCCGSTSNQKYQNIQPTANNNIYNTNNNNDFSKPIKYDFEYYKQNYMNKNNIINNNQIINISNSKIKNGNDIMNLNKQYNDIKIKNRIYYDDIEVQEKYLSNYKEFVSELNYQLSDLKDQLHISLNHEKLTQNILTNEENRDLLNDLEVITNNINEFRNLIEKQKHLLKCLENNFKKIQEQFNEIKGKYQYENKYSINTDSIKELLYENKNLVKHLNNNKLLYEKKRKEIENYISLLQNITKVKIVQIKTRRKKIYKNTMMNNFIELNDDSLFLKGSMLLAIKDFSGAKNIFKSMYIFRENDNDDKIYDQQKLVRKNWYEICYINNDCDIHDITYELKAVGLPDNMKFNSGSHGFIIDTNVDILLFEIDGIEQTDYEYEKYSLRFKINLKNLESNKIHIKYTESPKYEKMTEEEKNFRKIYRSKYYGLSERLVGENAKYILKNESDLEIINFDNEFFLKTNDNEYQWGGKVPQGGKKTVVRMSKKEGRVNFFEEHIIKSVDNSLIKNTTTEIPFCYVGGNNQIIQFKYFSQQTQDINMNQKKKVFEIKYININSKIAKFNVQGELINRCKGNWSINLTNEEIDSLIPNDFKTNKIHFNKIANDIIKEYDEEHKNDLIIVPSVVKIGKWVKKNIKYDITYVGTNDITASETLNNKRGVCHHITKLFNALMYSLGYQTIYILGYALDNKINYGIEDAHAWSLVKIDGKWLPFDATWGIFSGKLPITHIFKQTDCQGIKTLSYDKVKVEQINVKGNLC